jgi:hypothetical protein
MGAWGGDAVVAAAGGLDEGSERMSRTGCCALRIEERDIFQVVVEELLADVLLHEHAGDEGQHEVLLNGGGGVAASAMVVEEGLQLPWLRGRMYVEVGRGRARDEVGEEE